MRWYRQYCKGNSLVSITYPSKRFCLSKQSMKHTSPTAIKWCTPFKHSKARIKLFPEKLQQLDTRKAMQKAVVYFTAKATKCSLIIETKLFFFLITFSSHPLLSPFSILLLCMGFLLWWYIPSPLRFWLVFYSVLSVHVCHPFSLYVKFCMVSSVMGSVFCPTDILSLQENFRLVLLFLFPHMPLFFLFLFWNKQLKVSWRSQLLILASHTTNHYNSTNKLQN